MYTNFELEDEEFDVVFLNENNEIRVSGLMPSSGSDDILIDKIISSKSLNSINDRRSFISNFLFPTTYLSHFETNSKPTSTNTRVNKPIRHIIQNNKTSSTSTFRISSYYSDYIFTASL